MTIRSTLFRKPVTKEGNYIKGNFKKDITGKDFDNKNNFKTLKTEKAIVRDIFKTTASNENVKGEFTYTIQLRDNKRLTKDGTLRVYNMRQPIDIPIVPLLGKWNREHVGIILVSKDGEWLIEGRVAQQSVHRQDSRLIAAMRLVLKFAMA